MTTQQTSDLPLPSCPAQQLPDTAQQLTIIRQQLTDLSQQLLVTQLNGRLRVENTWIRSEQGVFRVLQKESIGGIQPIGAMPLVCLAKG